MEEGGFHAPRPRNLIADLPDPFFPIGQRSARPDYLPSRTHRPASGASVWPRRTFGLPYGTDAFAGRSGRYGNWVDYPNRLQ